MNTARVSWFLALCLGLVALLGGCTKEPPAVSAPPAAPPAAPRVVALSPALAIIARDLGLAEHIVGRHGYDLALDPALPVCGDQAGIDYEALLRARPTHVLLQWGDREQPARLRELAAQNRWTILAYDPLTIEAVVQAAMEMRQAFSAVEKSPRAEVDARMVELQSLLRTDPAPAWSGRVLLLESVQPPAALGPGSWHHEILERCGGRPAITTGGAYQRLDAEGILSLAPDGIILVLPRSPRTPETPRRNRLSEFTKAELEASLGPLAGRMVPAIREGRVALIDDPLGLTPSTAMVGVRDRVREILKAWGENP